MLCLKVIYLCFIFFEVQFQLSFSLFLFIKLKFKGLELFFFTFILFFQLLYGQFIIGNLFLHFNSVLSKLFKLLFILLAIEGLLVLSDPLRLWCFELIFLQLNYFFLLTSLFFRTLLKLLLYFIKL